MSAKSLLILFLLQKKIKKFYTSIPFADIIWIPVLFDLMT